MTEFEKFEQDRLLFGDLQKGVYKNLKWETRRHKTMLHWNCYVETPRELSPEEYEKLESLSHFGITGSYNGMIGFDTVHYTDFNPKLFQMMGYKEEETYKDLNYVKNVAFRMIDYLSTLKN